MEMMRVNNNTRLIIVLFHFKSCGTGNTKNGSVGKPFGEVEILTGQEWDGSLFSLFPISPSVTLSFMAEGWG